MCLSTRWVLLTLGNPVAARCAVVTIQGTVYERVTKVGDTDSFYMPEGDITYCCFWETCPRVGWRSNIYILYVWAQ